LITDSINEKHDKAKQVRYYQPTRESVEWIWHIICDRFKGLGVWWRPDM